MGFGGKGGGSRAARADGTVVWVWNSRSKQLARMERDFAAHTTALEMADAAKWVNRQDYCLTQPRATIIMSMPAGPCVRPTAEAAERRHPLWKRRRVALHSTWELAGVSVCSMLRKSFCC